MRDEELHRLRSEILDQVSRGTLSPADAERAAAAAGLGPLAHWPETDDFNPLNDVFWNLSMALVSIAFQNKEEVCHQWPAYLQNCLTWRAWEDGTGHQLTTPDPVPVNVLALDDDRRLAKAVQILLRAAQSGSIKIFGINQATGRNEEAPEAVLVHARIISNPGTAPGSLVDEIWEWIPGKPLGARYESIRVRSADVLGLAPWPEEKKPEVPADPNRDSEPQLANTDTPPRLTGQKLHLAIIAALEAKRVKECGDRKAYGTTGDEWAYIKETIGSYVSRPAVEDARQTINGGPLKPGPRPRSQIG